MEFAVLRDLKDACDYCGIAPCEVATLTKNIWGAPHFQRARRCGVCHTVREVTGWNRLPSCALPPCALFDLPREKEEKKRSRPLRTNPLIADNIVGNHNIQLRFQWESLRLPTVSEAAEAALDDFSRRPQEEQDDPEIRDQLFDLEVKKEMARQRERARAGVWVKPRTIRILGITCPRVAGNWKIYRKVAGEHIASWKRRIHQIRRDYNEARQIQRDRYWTDMALNNTQLWAEKTFADENPFNALDFERNLSLRDVYGRDLPDFSRWRHTKVRVPKSAPVFGPKPNKAFNYIEGRLEAKKLLSVNRGLSKPRSMQTEKFVIDKFSHVLTYVSASVENFSSKRKCPTLIVGQMDGDRAAHGQTSVTTPDQSSNVVLVDSREPSTAIASIPSRNAYIDLAASTDPSDPKTWSRWTPIKRGEWRTNVTGSILTYNFFEDMFNDPVLKFSPALMSFFQHAYFNGNLDIELKLNSNARQYGQLQVAFYYGAKQDRNFEMRKNIYTCSQMPHALLDIASSNTASLKVPFEYINPLMCTFTRSAGRSVHSNCSFGTLLINVICPLTVSATTADHCDYTVYVKFSDCVFSGMIDRSFITGNMMSVVKELGKMALENMDQPTVNQVGTAVINVNTGSWSAGTGIPEYNNVFRLDPTKILSYESGRIPQGTTMTVDSIKRTFGLIKVIDWTAQNGTGDQLFCFPAAPIASDEYYKSYECQTVKCCYYPPIAVLSSMSAYWKGSLEFRFDLIGATEISGRLTASFIPRVCDATVSADLAASSTSLVLDMQENRQFVYKIPYLTDTIMRRRHFEFSVDGDELDYPGMMYLHVTNRLIANSTIPDSCKVAIYMRGGPDFEIAVPAPPIFGLAFDTTVLFPPSGTTKELIPRSGYYPVYAGNWRFFTKSNGQQACILRYGEVSDHIAQYYCTGKWTAISGKVLVCESAGSSLKVKTSAQPIVVTKFFACRFFKWYADQYIFVIVPKQDSASLAALSKLLLDDDKGQADYSKIADLCLDYYAPGDYATPALFKLTPSVGIYGQMDERSSTEAPVITSFPTAASGMQRILGESFTDLKDFCRRYQLYAKGLFNVPAYGNSLETAVSIAFPVLPQGLNLDIGSPDHIKETFNRYRDGIIPIVCSGFRFFSGGIRLRLVFNAPSGVIGNTRFYVSHHPSSVPSDLSVQVISAGAIGSEGIEAPGFAYHIQMNPTNAVISIEIPFYKEYVRTYLQRPVNNKSILCASSLGNVNVSVSCNCQKLVTFGYEIYYSFADDATCSVFQGFPPMFRLTNISGRKRERALSSPDMSLSNEIQNDLYDRVMSSQRLLKLEIVSEELQQLVKENSYRLGTLSSRYQLTDSAIKMLNEINKIVEGEQWTAHTLNQLLAVRNDPAREILVMSRITRKLPRPHETERLAVGNMMCAIQDVLSIPSKIKRVDNLISEAESISPKIKETVDKVNDLADQASETMSDVAEVIGFSNKLVDMAKLKLNDLTKDIPFFSSIMNSAKYVSLFTNTVSQIIHCCLTPDAYHIAVAIVTFLLDLGLISLNSIGQLVSHLAKLIISYVDAPSESNGGAGPVGNGPASDPRNSIGLEYISLVFGAICSLFKFKSDCSNERKNSWCELIFNGINNFTYTSDNMIKFLRNHINALQDMFNYAFSRQPVISDILFLEQYSEQIYKWAVETIEMVDVRNESKIMSNMSLAARVYDLANQGLILHLKLTKLDNVPASKLSVVNSLVLSICKLRDRLARLYITPPVRFEPFVVYCAGPSRIGKTNAIQAVLEECLLSINYKSYSEITYIRNVGNNYWNNLNNQPICFYDDFYMMKTPEHGDVQIAEIMQLKSRALFNPPKAAIEEKEIRYNPLIVGICSNHSFPQLVSATHPDAFYNRRDVLIYARMKEEFAGQSVAEMEEDIRNNFDQIEFYIYPKVNENREIPQDAVFINYETLKLTLSNRFQQYYERECRVYTRLVQKAARFLPQSDDELFKWPDTINWHSFNEQLGIVAPEDMILSKEFSKEPAKNFSDYVNICKNSLNSYLEFLKIKPKGNGQMGISVEDDFASPPLSPEDELIDLSPKTSPCDYDFMCPHQYLHFVLLHKPHLVNYIPSFDQHRLKYPAGHYTIGLIEPKQFSECEVFIRISSQSYSETDESTHGDYIILDKTAQLLKIFEMSCGNCTCWLNHHPAAAFEIASLYRDTLSESLATTPELFAMMPFALKDFQHQRLKVIDFLKPELTDEWSDDPIFLGLPPGAFGPEKEFILPPPNDDPLIKRQTFNANSHPIPPKKTWRELFGGWSSSLVDKVVGAPKLMTKCWRKWYRVCMDPVTGPAAMFVTTLVLVEAFLWLLIGFTKLIKFFTSSKKKPGNGKGSGPKPPAGGQGFSSGDFKTHGKKNDKRNIKKKELKPPRGGGPEDPKGQMSDQEFKAITDLIFKNTFWITARANDNSTLTGRCLGIAANYAILVDHYWEAWENFRAKKEGVRFYITHANYQTDFDILWEELEYQPFNDSSIGLVKLPKRFPFFKNITKQICPLDKHEYVNGVGKIIEISESNSIRGTMLIHNVNYTPDGPIKVGGATWFSDFDTGELYTYQGFSGVGKCGSILLATNLPKPIIGIHVAGTSDGFQGWSESISFEDFEHLTNCLSATGNMYGDPEGCRLVLNTQVLGLGRVSGKFAHHENDKSRIKPSFVQLFQDDLKDNFKVYTDISVLSPNDPRIQFNRFSPLLEGCKFHGQPLLELDPKLVQIAFNDVKDLILTVVKPLRPNVNKISKLQAAAGIPFLEGYSPLEWRTSEGFPFASMRPKGVHDKRWLFEFDEQGICRGLSPLLLERMKSDKALRMNREIPNTIFTDCLKDCTVAKEKVLLPGKTRVFSMAPVQYTLQQRQYTLDFVAAYMKNRIKSEHAVGINPDSVEWKHLADYLGEVNLNNIISADFSKFGDRLPFVLIEKAIELMRAWYIEFTKSFKPSHDAFFDSMCHEVGHALHLMLDLIYQVICGQPSGNSLTVIINGIVGKFLTRIAYLVLTAGTRYCSMYEYHQHVRLVTYGDDQIISVSDEIKEMFNGITLRDFYASIGLKFTSADKSDNMVPYTSIWEASFLKKGFKQHPVLHRQKIGILLAPLEVASIEDCINWVWDNKIGEPSLNNPKYIKMSKQICEDAARLAFSRGPEYYETFTNKIKKFWRRFGETIDLMEWAELDFKVFDLNENLTNYVKFNL